MNGKLIFVGVLTVFIASIVWAVPTAEIDSVREKNILDSKDMQSINAFVDEAVRQLAQNRDFANVAKDRAVILSRATSNQQSAIAQYQIQFIQSARDHIASELDQAALIPDPDLRMKVMINLLIVADGLKAPTLAEVAASFFNNQNTAVSYWAVHCAANPAVINQLNEKNSANEKLVELITQKLAEITQQAEPEVLSMIIQFAGGVNGAKTLELLEKISDERMKKYVEWSVDNELVDETLLRMLCNKMTSPESQKPTIGRKFAQLYSYAIQRYVKGRDFLTDNEKQQAISVLIETEQACISKLLSVPQSIIKKAVEQEDYTALQQEQSRILGGQSQEGQLPLKLKFDYGKNPDGSSRSEPLSLPEPPQT